MLTVNQQWLCSLVIHELPRDFQPEWREKMKVGNTVCAMLQERLVKHRDAGLGGGRVPCERRMAGKGCIWLQGKESHLVQCGDSRPLIRTHQSEVQGVQLSRAGTHILVRPKKLLPWLSFSFSERAILPSFPMTFPNMSQQVGQSLTYLQLLLTIILEKCSYVLQRQNKEGNLR